MQADWNTPIYAFFEATPDIEHVNGRRVHVFKCLAKSCKGKGRHGRLVNRYLDTTDARSTGNLRKHAKLCWTEATIRAADGTKNLGLAKDAVRKSESCGDKLRDTSLTAMFEHLSNNGNVTYSHRQHTKTETKYVPF